MWTAGRWEMKGVPAEPQGPPGAPKLTPSTWSPLALRGAGPALGPLRAGSQGQGLVRGARPAPWESGAGFTRCESETSIANYTPGPSHRPPTSHFKGAGPQAGRESFWVSTGLPSSAGCSQGACVWGPPPALGALTWAWPAGCPAELAGWAPASGPHPDLSPEPLGPSGQGGSGPGRCGGSLARSPHPRLPWPSRR